MILDLRKSHLHMLRQQNCLQLLVRLFPMYEYVEKFGNFNELCAETRKQNED